MRLEVLLAVNVKWDVAPCSLIDGYKISEERAAFIYTEDGR
jgi:hypothetical protein